MRRQVRLLAAALAEFAETCGRRDLAFEYPSDGSKDRVLHELERPGDRLTFGLSGGKCEHMPKFSLERGIGDERLRQPRG